MVWNSKYARPLTASQIIVLLSSFRNERMKHFADARFSCACLVFCVGICLCSFCNRMHSSLGAQFICLDFQVPRKKGRQRVMSECFCVCERKCKNAWERTHSVPHSGLMMATDEPSVYLFVWESCLCVHGTRWTFIIIKTTLILLRMSGMRLAMVRCSTYKTRDLWNGITI